MQLSLASGAARGPAQARGPRAGGPGLPRPPPGRAAVLTRSFGTEHSVDVDAVGSVMSGEWEGCCVVFDGLGEAQASAPGPRTRSPPPPPAGPLPPPPRRRRAPPPLPPQPIPDYYCPPAFKEWGIELFDWQTQASSRVVEGRLELRTKKLMPTQGCEADAVAFEEEASSPLPLKTSAVSPDGGFCVAPRTLGPAEGATVRVEHCLPALAGAGAGGARERTRVVHVLHNADGSPGGWRLRSQEVVREEWEGDFNGGTELFACGAGSRKLAGLARPGAADLAGTWGAAGDAGGGGASVVGFKYGDMHWMLESPGAGIPLSKVVPEMAERLAGADRALLTTDEGELWNLALLPGGVWSLLDVTEDGSVISEAGWFVGDGLRRVSNAVFDQGTLVVLTAGTEARRPGAAGPALPA